MAVMEQHAVPGYTLEQLIATGGMAEVYRATQHSLGRAVAVKIMKSGDDSSMAERFQREARLVATLNHPHIVHIYDVGLLADGLPYLSMELLTGGDLASRIQRGVLRDADIRRIIGELAEGLAVIHGRGIIHRDIKPANILFRDNGDAVLSDFGIAKAEEIQSELTQAGIVVGSPAYCSPEQINAQPLDGRSDLYSLGVVLLEMLLGHNPFRASDYTGTVVNQVQLPLPTLPGSQAHWQPLVDRLLAKDRDQRPADALVVVSLLAAVPAPLATAGAMDVTALNPTPVSLLPPARRKLSGLLLAIPAAGVLLLAGWGWHYHRQQQEIAHWLVLGDERLSTDQLAAPPGDNAEYYYQQAQHLDAQNQRARDGLIRVGARYAGLAARARDEGDLKQATDDVEHALAISPNDPQLIKLRDELRAQQRERVPTGHHRRGVKGFLDNLFGR